MVWPTDYDSKMSEYNAMELPGLQLASSQAHNSFDHLLNLNVSSAPPCIRLTGIIATIGISTMDIEIMEKMMGAGMNIARIPMSSGNIEYHQETIKMLRQAAKNYSLKVSKNYPLAIALELNGRMIRTGTIADTYGTQVELKTGDVVRLTTDDAYKDKCSNYTIFVDFDTIADQLKKGDWILIDSENIQLRVEIVSTSTLTCKIERGGFLGSHKEVFIPNVKLDMPNYSEADEADVQFAIREQVDMLIVPLVRDARSVTELKDILGEKGKKIAVIAKIQTSEGFENLDQILDEADCIQIARLELGSDISPKKLVIAQKNIIARANKANVACCVSAQLLHTMTNKKIPLRSEILDVSNCVIDGADSLLLSSETASGLYPVEAVAYQSSICKEAEACMWTKQIFADMIDKTPMPCDSVTGIALAAVLAAQRSLAASIIVVTTSGRSARLVAKYRPRCPIMAVTRYSPIARQLQMWRGIVPIIYEDTPHPDWQEDVESRVNFAIRFGLDRGFVRIGDPLVLVTGWKQGSGFTNTMRLVYAAEDTTNLF